MQALSPELDILLDIQVAIDSNLPFDATSAQKWVETALKPHIKKAELTLRVVEAEEIRNLNQDYREKDRPTNVLAFPSELPDDVDLEYTLLGDVIICPAVLQEESTKLNIPLTAHCAHIIIHGVLHLLGFDHMKLKDAQIMESFEIEALHELGFQNPYL